VAKVSWDDVTVIHCAGCTVVFCITNDFARLRFKDHRVFWCPNGCQNRWPEPEEDEETAELERTIAGLRAKITHLEDENEALSRGLRQEPRGVHAASPQNDN
jgi:hypothetical protein